MKRALALLLLCTPAFSSPSHSEPPTYKADPHQAEEYATGYVRPERPLTMEQFKVQKELDDLANDGEISYDYDVTQIGRFSTGFVKPSAGFQAMGPGEEVDDIDTPEHKEIDFRELLGEKAPAVLNQGNCGSCVTFSFTENAQWSMALRRVDIPALSPQHLMSCGGSAGQCSGDYGERVAGRLITLGELTDVKSYPYAARTSKCRVKDSMPLFGSFKAWKTVPGDFQTLVEQLNARRPISVGVAADNRWSSYKSGVYNGFGSMGTNHYVLIVGASCGTSVDKDHNCLFNAKRQLVNGNSEAQVVVLNSWGPQAMDRGFITMQFENKQGKRNNNIAGGQGNAQVIDTKIPWTPPEPVSFVMESAQMTLNVTVQPSAKYSVDKAKSMLQMALDQVGK